MYQKKIKIYSSKNPYAGDPNFVIKNNSTITLGYSIIHNFPDKIKNLNWFLNKNFIKTEFITPNDRGEVSIGELII